MRNQMRLAMLISGVAAMVGGPAIAETKRNSRADAGVQKAIAFQRAKDRADAAQARKEARHPEHFTYAEPNPAPETSLADQQRRDALERSRENSADREAPPR
jgi:hypothetical protein